MQGINGKFYGVTYRGGSTGSDGCGTVFEITGAAKLTTLHSFSGTDGCGPDGGLIQAADGKFYGTTPSGGTNGGGTLFRITAAGTFTTLYNFCSLSQCADGSDAVASLIQGTDGSLYGTTETGGTNNNDDSCFNLGCGTIFKITAKGTLTTLYNFCSLSNCVDGINPAAGLVQSVSGGFYGTTSAGGVNCYTDDGCGTIFEITAAGNLTTLYSFCSLSDCADGMSPWGSLVEGTDEKFYGTTYQGTATGYGTVFEVSSSGTLTTLYSFCPTSNCSDGRSPAGGLLQATNGIFYGTTNAGGTSNDGTVFSLDTGLAPFVSFIRNPAKVGQQFGILGYGLTGTSSVSLNGVPASFTVRADTLLIATVPAGATTGYVTVATPSGTLTSNVPFRVLQ